MIYDFGHFGPIELEDPGSYYDTHIKWKDKLINLELMFSGAPVTDIQLEKVDNLIDRIPELESRSRQIIETEAQREGGGLVAEYADKVLASLKPEFHPELIDEQDATPRHIQIMRKMEFESVCLEPEEEKSVACFTYCVDWKLTRCLFNIYFDNNGDFHNSIHIYDPSIF